MDLEKSIKFKTIALIVQIIGFVFVVFGYVLTNFNPTEDFITREHALYLLYAGITIVMISRISRLFLNFKNSDSVYQKYTGFTLIAVFIISLALYFAFR